MLGFEGYSFYAHNSEYDLSGLLENIISSLNYPDDKILYSGSNLISLSKCVRKQKNGKKADKKYYVTFLDSINYFKSSLEALGEAIGLKKLKCIAEYETMDANSVNVYYCKRDCDILEKALNNFFDVLRRYGVKPRLTIAGNALALFRTAFLKQDFKVNVKLDNKFHLSYYGGRTEAFDNYSFEGQCYDFNSLYPSVMQKEFRYPNPQMLRKGEGLEVLLALLNNPRYEGVAKVRVKCDMNIPLLPFKQAGKLYFPTSKAGTMEGYYNFPELREALNSGYEILEAGEIIYSVGMPSPFGEYVEKLYNLRLAYKAEGSCLELFVKYLLNSLYGKFGQQDEKKEFGSASEIKERPGQVFEEFLNAPGCGYWKEIDPVTGDVVKTRSSHACFCWCSYVTSYARVKLYRAFKALNFEVAYCDTDSIFTNSQVESSKELGELKEEYQYKEGHFIKAKHYGIVKYGKFKGEGFITYDKSVKIKGVRGATDENATNQTLKKVFKNKEALGNRRINPDTGKLYRSGEAITINKKISLLDQKRKWKDGKSEPYDVEELKLNINLIEVKI